MPFLKNPSWLRFFLFLWILPVAVPLAARPCFAADSSAPKTPWQLIAEGELLGGYSEIKGRDGVGSFIADWLVSPTLKAGERAYWINLYNGSYNRSAQVVAQEEGGRRTQETQTHSLSTALRWEMNDNWSLRPIVFADWIFVNETEDESFGNGLYDYRDIGAGLESAWTLERAEGLRRETRLGFRYIDREYPNYQSLLSVFNPNSTPEVNEKDLQGYKFNYGYDHHSRDHWSWGAEGISFFKDYTDKRTINANGIRSAEETREDFLQVANVYVSRPLSTEYTFRLDGQVAFNDSNLDFYDTHNTANPGDDDLIGDYFDYVSFALTPSLVYTRQWGPEKEFRVSASYSFYLLHYPDRRAQNALGVYQSEEQEDTSHTFSGRVSVPLTKNWSWVSFLSYTVAESNQAFEAFYLYEYDVWTAVTGVSFKY